MLLTTGRARPRLSLTELWACHDQSEWDYCAGALYESAVRPERLELYRDLETPGLSQRIARMTTEEFYTFLYDDFFRWKFTVGPQLAGNRRMLATHLQDGSLDRIERVRGRLVDRGGDGKGSSIKMIMGRNGGIHGLGVPGACGLLALVHPQEFGTVDVMVTRAMQLLGIVEADLVDPENISVGDAVRLIEIMCMKAHDLNSIFGTDKWTPRRIDRVLWVAGR